MKFHYAFLTIKLNLPQLTGTKSTFNHPNSTQILDYYTHLLSTYTDHTEVENFSWRVENMRTFVSPSGHVIFIFCYIKSPPYIHILLTTFEDFQTHNENFRRFSKRCPKNTRTFSNIFLKFLEITKDY